MSAVRHLPLDLEFPNLRRKQAGLYRLLDDAAAGRFSRIVIAREWVLAETPEERAAIRRQLAKYDVQVAVCDEPKGAANG